MLQITEESCLSNNKNMFGTALYFVCFVGFSQCSHFHTSLIIDEVRSCPEEDTVKYFDMRNLTLTLIGDKTYLNGNFIVAGQTPGPTTVKAIANAVKCKHKNLPETCEKMFDFVFKSPCTSWNRKGQIWSSAIASISPMLECRMKNNVYTVTNGTIDGDIFKRTVPDAEKYYWKFKIKMFFNGELHVCGQISCGFQKFPGKQSDKQ